MNLLNEEIKLFWERVDVRGEGECWNWKFSTRNGYGQFRYRARTYYAHRVAWEIANGRAPKAGMEISHAPVICHNRKCCNPSHLTEKTRGENGRDKLLDGTENIGERHGMAKLTIVQVQEIRALSNQGVSQRSIGERFGVGQAHVCHIVKGHLWKTDRIAAMSQAVSVGAGRDFDAMAL